MPGLDQFKNITEILKTMPADHKAKIIAAHQNFHRLTSLLSAKKEIELLPKMTGIKVLKNTTQVVELKATIDFLKPGGFRWIDSKGHEDEPLKPKKPKKK